MSESGSETSSDTLLMFEDDDSILIEALDAQVNELLRENKTMKAKIEALEERLKTLQNITDSDIINNVFSFL